MRVMSTTAAFLLVAAPLMCIGASARADNNDWMGRAQQFLNNRGDDHDRDRDAYERGRQDEMRHQQAEQDRYRYRHNDSDREWSRDNRYRQPNYDYNTR